MEAELRSSLAVSEELWLEKSTRAGHRSRHQANASRLFAIIEAGEQGNLVMTRAGQRLYLSKRAALRQWESGH